MFTHLCIIYGCFCATTAELNSYNKDQIALFKAKNIWLFTEKLSMEDYWVSMFRVIGNSSIDSLNPLENHILKPTPSPLVDKIVSETDFYKLLFMEYLLYTRFFCIGSLVYTHH